MSITKKTIRNEYLKIRKMVIDKEMKSKIITKNLIKSKFYVNAKTIALYNSLIDEVNTSYLINKALKDKKVVLLPRVIDRKNMNFYRISSLNDEMQISHFNIKEPLNIDSNMVDKSVIDLVIVPGVCFDLVKNRIGYGKGYYDSFLQTINANKIGICFDEQILSLHTIPNSDNDIKMNVIITDKRFIK